MFGLQLGWVFKIIIEKLGCNFFIENVLFARLDYLKERFHLLSIEVVNFVFVEIKHLFFFLNKNTVLFNVAHKVLPTLVQIFILLFLLQKRIRSLNQHFYVALDKRKEEVMVFQIGNLLRNSVA
jgi:hypothetical protein